jgi:ubiquinone/menaquinone biosynthesis C-methylase UbiE
MSDRFGRALGRMRVEAVLPHVRGRLLDVGCGSNGLIRKHPAGIGIDVHPWSGVDLLVEDSARLPFEFGSFDTITLIASLNHIPNRDEVLDECRRLLHPDGRVVVTMLTPGVSRVWHWLRAPWDEDQVVRGMKAGELYGFTADQLVTLFNRHGFEFLSQHYFMLGFNRVYVFRLKR